MKAEFVLVLVLFICNVSHSQAPSKQSGSSAQSSLTVTAIVEPSVWLVMEPDDKSDVFVADAPIRNSPSLARLSASLAGKARLWRKRNTLP
jgi:hypothetical protein